MARIQSQFVCIRSVLSTVYQKHQSKKGLRKLLKSGTCLGETPRVLSSSDPVINLKRSLCTRPYEFHVLVEQGMTVVLASEQFKRS